MVFKKREAFASPLMEKLGLVRFLSSMAFALVSTIWAIYLESLLHNDSQVGFLIAFFSVISFISYFLIIPLLERKKKTDLYLLTLILYTISYLLFSFLQNIISIIILGIITSFIVSLRVASFGILIRNKSKNKDVSKNEGFVYTLANIAWLIGPLMAGFISSRYGLKIVFLFAAFFTLISFLLLRFFKVRDKVISKRVDTNLFKIFKDFFSKKERTIAYLLSGGINFWWAFIYIYIPIYIIKIGLGNLALGYFLALITIPLILSEYYFGRLASRIGFKKIFSIGYFILAVAAILSFFISNIYIILLIFILASFGAAMIEPTTESYFLDIITKREREKYYSIYNTTIDLNYFIANIFVAIMLLFLPFKSIFILFGIAMLGFSLLSLKIKNVFEKRRKD
ncbi:MFS transporter [Candidatus Pacearchaeota archaeon]|nr:MFS transporter [Candidatus Pacearchaeota archaeon]